MKKLVVLSLLVLLMVMPAVQADDIDWMQYGGSEITILMPEHPVLDGMRSVMEDFGSATGITVNVEALAENLYFDRMEVALRADAGVMDVYMVPMDSTAFTQWSNGLIHPLSPYINDSSMTSADYDFADFPGGFTQATQYPPGDMDAQDYAIPVSFEAYTLFYNKDIIDEYLDGEIPDTMGGLIEAHKASPRPAADRSPARSCAASVRTPLWIPSPAWSSTIGAKRKCPCPTTSGSMAIGRRLP